MVVCVGLSTASVAIALTETVNRVEIANGQQPQLFVAADGRVWLTYAQSGDIFVTSSNDEGTTFAEPTKVASVPHLMVGMRRGPRIVARAERVTVTAIAHELLAFHSDDGGKTWSQPVAINDVPTSAREGLHDVAIGPTGELFVTWLDLRSGNMELWSAQSTDNGNTWRKNEPLYRSPDGAICTCCHPSALYDETGNLAVMWRNSIAGCRDMWIAARFRGSDTFSTPRKLGEGSWKIDGCPMDGGRIIGLGHGRFATVWQRAGEVFFCPEQGAEISLGEGKHPVAVIAGESPVFVWQKGADLCLQRGFKSEPEKRAGDARFPVLISLANNRSALLAYEHVTPAGTRVAVERLEAPEIARR